MRSLGSQKMDIKLHKDVVAEITVRVLAKNK